MVFASQVNDNKVLVKPSKGIQTIPLSLHSMRSPASMFKNLRLSSDSGNPTNSFFATNGILIPLVFTLSAFLLVLCRLKDPILITGDLSAQIGATLNLLNGDGFGNFRLFNDAFKGLHIAIEPLTHFPPGMSLVLMLLLKLGLPLVVALKLVYAVASLLGWMLWGILFRNVIFDQPIPCNKVAYWLLYVSTMFIGALFPLLYTLNWNGTDLLLWSLTPYFIFLILSAAEKKGREQNIDFFCAGLLVSFLYFIRYSSIYLAAAFVIYAILQKYQLKKYLYFALGFSIFYVIVAAYKQSVSVNPLSWWTLSPMSLLDLSLLKQKFLIFSLYMPKPIIMNIASLLITPRHSWSSLRWLPMILLFMFASFSLLTAIIFSRSRTSLYPGELKFLSAYFLVTAMITSILLTIFSVHFLASDARYLAPNFNLSMETRYFYSLFPVLLFLSAHMFKVLSGVFYIYSPVVRFSRPKRILLWSAMNVSGICLLIALLFALISVKNTRLMNSLYSDLLTYSINYQHNWNNMIQERDPESVKFLQTLMQQSPNIVAVNFAENFDFGHITNPNLRRRIVTGFKTFRPQSIKRFMDNTISSHFYFIFNIDPNCTSYCVQDTGVPVDFSGSISQFELVYENDDEGIRIFEAIVQ
jgi:hypothetical protein